MVQKALEKLEREYKAGKYDRYADVMKQGTLEALKSFCEQDEEFARAVVEGGTFENCMKAVAKNCGKGISDLDAYTRAVRFYFPGAGIRMQMKIDLCDSVKDAPHPDGPCVMLDLADFW